jgi:glycosyl hydrolase family 43
VHGQRPASTDSGCAADGAATAAQEGSGVRRLGLAAITAATVLSLPGCSGKTTGATNITKESAWSYSARLNAVGSCDTTCTAFMRWRPVGQTTWTNAGAFTAGKASNAAWSQTARGLYPGPEYEYQACGKEASYENFVCAGPDGRQGTVHRFSVVTVPQKAARLDTAGKPLDAHDGGIVRFGDTFHLYGTSYACGFEWQASSTTFCGFKVYTSKDLVTWTDRGFLFDAQTPDWQRRCGQRQPDVSKALIELGVGMGCYRPHVIYNPTTGLYVLWVVDFTIPVDYDVFVSSSPTGPFTPLRSPTLAVNTGSTASVNNGDENLFVDSDGSAYIVYTDWRTIGGLVVERLDSTYTSGSGAYVRLPVHGVEAPSLFRRGGSYYVTFSDPACGYCTDTGTGYLRASAPLGTWSLDDTTGAPPPRFGPAHVISGASCGGQPTHVTPIEASAGTTYLYQSDLWDNRQKNQYRATHFWAPLSFDAQGVIRPIDCLSPAPRYP